ncbi:MAG: ATP-binding protein, partial [Gemmatimonadetes bacterium]|nr:ATP-binding protein [Gemmatimonadota bacterium]
LSTLEKGQLMVRHPHFAQPVFVRFPRPAVLSGREGVERFPQAAEPTLEAAITRSLRALEPAVTLDWVKDAIALAEEDEALRARNRTLQARPEDVKSYFRAQLKRRVGGERAPAPPRPALRTSPADDPYGF